MVRTILPASQGPAGYFAFVTRQPLPPHLRVPADLREKITSGGWLPRWEAFAAERGHG